MDNFRFRFHIRDLITLTLVVGLMLGLLLPAVNASRDAARRTECSNNLKLLGLGVHNHAAIYRGRVPFGTVQNSNLAPEQRLSWTVPLIPYLEQMYFLFQLNEPWSGASNLPPIIRIRNDDGTFTDSPAPRNRLFMCPGRKLPDVHGLSVTAYIGPAGVGVDAASNWPGHLQNGIWGYDRQAKLTDVTDGLSATVLFLETSRASGPWTAGGPPTVRGFEDNDRPIGPGRTFGGFHRSGCQAALADGSVRLIETDVDPRTFARLFTIAEDAIQSTDVASASLVHSGTD
jgi:hypothetical protein